MRQKLVLASSNSGKIIEFKSYLASLPVELILQTDLQIPDAEETGGTFVENAIIKARHASQISGMPAIADDSGLVVDALHGAPGIFSSRYAPDDRSRIEKLLAALREVPEAERTASFYCCIVYLRTATDPTPTICEGRWFGRILMEPIGTHGFGYDPIFYVPEYDRSAGELDVVTKNRISHRARAIAGLKSVLTK